jgi:hypothetical protein
MITVKMQGLLYLTLAAAGVLFLCFGTGRVLEPKMEREPVLQFVTLQEEVPSEIQTIIDLHGKTPVEFLDILKERKSDEYTFLEPMKYWISKEDLPALLAQVDSKEPCASVALSISSIYAPHSTVGQEALTLLEGYRKGKYPPALNSGGYGDEAKEALIQWCRSEMQKKDGAGIHYGF